MEHVLWNSTLFLRLQTRGLFRSLCGLVLILQPRSVVGVVGAASATSEAQNVQVEEEEVLEQGKESRGGNIKPDPLRIILFQVNNLVFVGKLSVALAPALLMVKLFLACQEVLK
jgi:hypothetical protein